MENPPSGSAGDYFPINNFITYYCDCGYKGPIVWISIRVIRGGNFLGILKEAEEKFNKIKT